MGTQTAPEMTTIENARAEKRRLESENQRLRLEVRDCHRQIANCNGCETAACHAENHGTFNEQGVCECGFCEPDVFEARQKARARMELTNNGN